MSRAASCATFVALALCASKASQAQEELLFDNGGIVTAIGAAPDGSSLSSVQSGVGLSLTGHAAVIAHDQRVADDFVVPAGGWRISRFEFTAFQPHSTRDIAPFDRVHLRVWDGVPGGTASSVVFGDLTTDRLVASVFAGVYRVTGSGSDVERPVFNATAGVGTLVLAPGTYWIEWQIGAPRDGGPFVPPVTTPGQSAAGNARQFANDWRAIVDGATAQALPFRIIGAIGTGGAASDTLFTNGFED